jgi:chromosome segregation ATPase
MTMNDDKRPMTDEEMALELRRIIVEPEPGDHFPVWDEWLEADKESALQDLVKVRELLCPKAEPLPPTCERGSNLADAVRAKDAEIADLRSKLETIGRRWVEALDNSANAAWELDRLCAEAAAKDAEIADLRSKLAKDERGTGPLRREIAELKQKVEQLTQDRDTERAMKTGCQQNLLEISADLNAIGASVKEDELISERAGRTLGEQQAEIELLTEERDELKQKVEQCRNDGSVLRDLVERLTKERDEMKSRVAGLENELSMVRKDFARACKERDEVKAKARAACTVEPLSEEELAKLVEHYLESDMGYTAFNLARDVAAAQRAKLKAQAACGVEPLSEAEIDAMCSDWRLDPGFSEVVALAHMVAERQRAKVKPVELPTVEEIAGAMSKSLTGWVWWMRWKAEAEAVHTMLRERMGGGK